MDKPDNPSALEGLSALVDGEADSAAAAAVCAAWRDQPEVRARWHRYHLIGDVMRSEELTGTGRDAAFLAALRTRLAQEPVVLAPTPATAWTSGGGGERGAVQGATQSPTRRARGMRRWAPPAALAAGFMVVAIGGVALLRTPTATVEVARVQAPVQLTSAQSPGASAAAEPVTFARQSAPVALASGLPSAGPVAEPATGILIRNARLDEYLAAHKQFGGTSALGVASGFLRNATYEGADMSPGSR